MNELKKRPITFTRKMYFCKRNLISITLLSVVIVMTLFMMSVEVRSPLIMETITVPCLKILLRLVKPPAPSSKANKVGPVYLKLNCFHASCCQLCNLPGCADVC